MIPNNLSMMDFMMLAEKIDESNSIGFNTGNELVIFGYSSMLFN